MVVIDAVPEDAEAILAIMASRPGALHYAWKAPVGAYWTLAHDEEGVAAFMAATIDEGGIVVHQLEGWWESAEPTVRAVRGISALNRVLNALADSERLPVYSICNLANERQLAAQRAHGYETVPVVVLKREPR